MPVLANGKHEIFAQCLASGMRNLPSYVAAGYPSSPSSASQLANRTEVMDRVAELRSESVANAAQARADDLGAADPVFDGTMPEREELIKMLREAAQLAQTAGQYQHVIKAVQLIASLAGYLKQPPAPSDAASRPTAPSVAGSRPAAPKDLNRLLSGLSGLFDDAPEASVEDAGAEASDPGDDA